MTRTGEDGFTLLEALASVAVMAVLLGSLAAVAGQWLPNWRHGFATLQAADLVGLALDRIVEDVGSAEYARADGGQGAPLFLGESASVTFVRRAIGPDAGPRLEAVRVAETETRQGVELQRAHARFAPAAIGEFQDAATLLRPPLRLEFAYAGPDGQWVPVWRAQEKLPRAMRLSVRARTGALVASTAFLLKVTEAPEITAQAQTETPPASRADKSE